MTLVAKKRPVTVEGVVYEVPTNVCWSTTKDQPRWITSGADASGKMNLWAFRVSRYGSVQKALDAAILRAKFIRPEPTAPVYIDRSRRLDDQEPLPQGVKLQEFKKGGFPYWRLMAYHTVVKPAKVFTIGPKGRYTQNQYDAALEKAIAHRAGLVKEYATMKAKPAVATSADVHQALNCLDEQRAA